MHSDNSQDDKWEEWVKVSSTQELQKFLLHSRLAIKGNPLDKALVTPWLEPVRMNLVLTAEAVMI